jgi:hypothetical protein
MSYYDVCAILRQVIIWIFRESFSRRRAAHRAKIETQSAHAESNDLKKRSVYSSIIFWSRDIRWDS